MVIYIDDILTYIKTMEEHVEPLINVFLKLKEHKLYTKFEKCNLVWKKQIFLDIKSLGKGYKWMIAKEM
jgi:hypothetical protein